MFAFVFIWFFLLGTIETTCLLFFTYINLWFQFIFVSFTCYSIFLYLLLNHFIKLHVWRMAMNSYLRDQYLSICLPAFIYLYIYRNKWKRQHVWSMSMNFYLRDQCHIYLPSSIYLSIYRDRWKREHLSPASSVIVVKW